MVLFTNEGKSPIRITMKLVLRSAAGALCLMLAGVLLFIDPLQIITTHRMTVTNGSEVHKFLMKKSEVIHLSMFLFNVTNSDAFLSGEDNKLKVQEVGPFTYREDRVNEDLEIDEDLEVVRYRPRIEVSFLQEKSIAHPDNVTLTLPNLTLLGLATMFSSFPFWTRSSLEVIAAAASSDPLISVDATSYLWGHKDPIIALANKLAPGMVYFDKLGLLDRLYDKETPNYLEVSARNTDKFSIRTRNGHRKLGMGNMANPDECEECDSFENVYEGLGYPSPTTPETPITLFRNGLCRTLPLSFHKHVVLNSGVPGLLFNLSNSFYMKGQNGTNNILLDLKGCFYGIPVALSKLYFEDLDPALHDRVEGVPPPDPNRGSYMIIEPMVAMELETYVRVQVNLVLGDISFNSRTRRFSNMMIPIGYLELIQPPLPEETSQILHLMHVTVPVVLLLLKLALTLVGAGLLVYPFLGRLLRRVRSMQAASYRQLPTKDTQLSNKDSQLSTKATRQPLLIENCTFSPSWCD